ncbi:MAG TPA: Spy/CpxP family protein refolding chaperone [Bryobacteraceae bacterium]|nr:Spy/CpxP family protein refolding chaperone [Bryobacteraceae bacterium]
MKHFDLRIPTLLCLAGGWLLAQSPTARTATSFGAGIVTPAFLPPAPPATDPVAYWTTYLGLDSAQQGSLRTILSDQQNSVSSLKANLNQAHDALRAAAKGASSDPAIDNLAANLGAVYAQVVAVQAKAYARFYVMLTPDQKQKLDTLMTLPAGGAMTVVSSGDAPGVPANP